MADTWKYLKSSLVYIYPSANADDGGDVNSESNIADITNHLVQKNFVVRRNKEDSPLSIDCIGDNRVRVRNGIVVIDGIAVKLDSGSSNDPYFCTYDIDSSKIQNYEVVYKDYVNDPNKKMFIVIKLLKDTTGNVRGDLLTLEPSGKVINYCRGCSVGVVTSLDDLDSYIVIGSFIPENLNQDGFTLPGSIDQPGDIYSYIDIDSVSSDGKTLFELLNQWIVDLFQNNSFSSINYYDRNKVCRKTALVTEGNFGVIEYDSSGNPINEKSYSVDDINSRTHVAESGKYTENVGVYGDLLSKDLARTYNGTSTLIARADHSHDSRYIRAVDVPDKDSYGKVSDSSSQKVGSLRLYNALQVGSKDKSPFLTIFGSGKVVGDLISIYQNTHGSDGRPTVCLKKRTGINNDDIDVYSDAYGDDPNYTDDPVDLVVSGNITANKVYNAVWNDYAELFKKFNPNEVVEPGTVICKVKGEDAYTSSKAELSKLVVGVCSNTYGHLLGGDPEKSLEDNLKEYIPVALSGRVKVKLSPRCIVEEGDLLSVSGYAGCVTSCEYPDKGTIVGKALESSDGTKDKILMLVMLS